MSKLLKIYEEQKKKDTKKIYLFKNGIFYYMLNEDATIVSKTLGLKITQLGNNIIKCGFPVQTITKYEKLFKENNLKYEILDTTSSNNYKSTSNEQILKQIKNLDLSNTTPLECFDLIYNIQKTLKSR